MCSALALGHSSDAETTTGASANHGNWWVRTAQMKRQHRGESQGVPHAPASTQAEEGEVEAPSPFAERVSRFGYSFSEHRTNHFELLYRQKNVPADVIDETGDLLELAHDEFVAQFKLAGFDLAPVKDRLTWVVFDDQDHYHDYARVADGMDTPYLESYYAARSNQVVLMQITGLPSWRTDRHYYGTVERTTSKLLPISGMDQPAQVPDRDGGGGMLDVRRAVHEAAHQLAFNTGIQKRGVMYPLWVSEGLATNFECDSSNAIGMAGENAPRKRQLLRAHAGGRLVPLESFVTMARVRSGGATSANDLYAQSWGMFNFLFTTRKSDLKKYLAGLAVQEPGSRDESTMLFEFTRAFGSISRLDRAWTKYLDMMAR